MKKIIAAGLLVLFFIFTGCSAQEQAKGPDRTAAAAPKKLTPQQAKTMMDSGSPYTLVDVRTAAEFSTGHIKGAILFPDNEIAARASKELPDKDAVIIVYCRSGARSSGAAKVLAGLGYTNIYDLGGIINWPYGTVTD
ncbi:MAG: rhodanese-like domain-containing protein [Treponema sp.]|nr:rhodanese-like domain-containing protein [Treponema sp.]